jgi:hypothetical protein
MKPVVDLYRCCLLSLRTHNTLTVSEG